MKFEKIGIVGFGQMGSGIAQVTAAAGYPVIVSDADQKFLDAGLARIGKLLDRAIEKGKATAEDKEQLLARITTTTNVKDFADCDLVIEAVNEDFAIKREIYEKLDTVCKPEAVFASNTSSLSITEMAAITRRPERFVGLHFFNPVPVMKLVEVVKTITVDQEVFDAALAFGESVGKTVVRAKDSCGFVVNLLLVPYLLDAVRWFENGLASREDIDNAMMLGCGHPMGPLTLCDFIGLDTMMHIGDIMFDEFREARFAPPPLLRRMVTAGYLGKKSGRGFYDYSK